MRDKIRLLVNGRSVAVGSEAPWRTLLPWLRGRGLTSVKEGCGEGDCGACTVMLGRPRDDESGFDWRSACSCILLLPQLDGCAILTAEGIKEADGTLHPAQQLMAEGGGTQCGFCTPGFVMALAALSRTPERDEETILDTISGNLCRCTGYRPIVEAARALPQVAAPEAEAAQAAALAVETADVLDYATPDGQFFAPRELQDALFYRAANPTAWILSGGTDLGLSVTKRHAEPDNILYLGRVEALGHIVEADDWIRIGATVTYSDALAAIEALDPTYAGLVRRIGGTQIRNMGTIGGNIGNASPIGDSMPALIALGAEIELAASGATRAVPAADFITGYRKTVMAEDELIASIRIPRPTPGSRFFAWKIARRIDQDISAICACFLIREENGVVVEARAGFGGVAARPLLITGFEALIGKPWDAAVARAAVLAEVTPLTDHRGTDWFRRTVCANLVERLTRELSGDRAPVTLEAL